MSEVIYQGEWQVHYNCSLCDYHYGISDPLHTYWKQCCPNCGAQPRPFSPPVRKTSKRFNCTYKATWFERIFNGKSDTGFYETVGEVKDSEDDAETLVSTGGGIGINALHTASVLSNTTMIAGAASIALF